MILKKWPTKVILNTLKKQSLDYDFKSRIGLAKEMLNITRLCFVLNALLIS